MQGKLSYEQGEFLMYVPVVEEYIAEHELDMTLEDALNSLIEGSSRFTFEIWEELVDLGYIDYEGNITQAGKVFVSEQHEKEEKENAEKTEKQKKQRTESVVTAISSVVGSVVGEVVKKIMGGVQ